MILIVAGASYQPLSAMATGVGVPSWRSLVTDTQCRKVEPTEAVISGCPFEGGRNSPCIPGSSCFSFNELTDECVGPEEDGFFGQCCDDNQQCTSGKIFMILPSEDQSYSSLLFSFIH